MVFDESDLLVTANGTTVCSAVTGSMCVLSVAGLSDVVRSLMGIAYADQRADRVVL